MLESFQVYLGAVPVNPTKYCQTEQQFT